MLPSRIGLRLLAPTNRVGQNRKMITVSQESWVSLATLGAFAIALFGYLRNISRDLTIAIRKVGDNVDRTRTELKSALAGFGDKGDIAGLDVKLDKTRTELVSALGATRTELKGDITGGFAKVEARLIALEQRTYDISTRLPAAPASTSTP